MGWVALKLAGVKFGGFERGCERVGEGYGGNWVCGSRAETYVRPVERRTPARKADTVGISTGQNGHSTIHLRTQYCVEGIVGNLAELRTCELQRYIDRVQDCD